MVDKVLGEAERLWNLGFAIHWLRPRSKVPVNSGWTSGPRKSWEELKAAYRKGYNVGVRLGEASKIGKRFLTVVDVDVKGTDTRYRDEAAQAVRALLGGRRAPMVKSGREGASRHYYVLSKRPFKGGDVARSEELVKVFMPSEERISRRDRERLTEKELSKGYRIRRAWEVTTMSEGRQVVLPPSIHPDSGKPYLWKRPVEGVGDLPRISVDNAVLSGPGEVAAPGKRLAVPDLEGFAVSPVELAWLPISDSVRKGIVEGAGVSDRSAYLLRASTALHSAGLSRDEVLSVLTDETTFLGATAYEHARTNSRKRAAEWVWKHTFRKVEIEREGKTREGKSIFSFPPIPPRKLSKEEQAKTATAIEAARSWRQDIVLGGNGQPAKLVQNVVHIISNAVRADVVRRDEFAYRDSYSRKTPWGGKRGDIIVDDDVAKIKYWLGTEYQFEPPSAVISDGLTVIACRNAYDPVRDFLDALPAWDGEARLDGWLEKNFGAKGDPEYLSQVFRKWMIGMVMRIYEPGAKFDWMPIFEGAQNIGKSSFGRLLVGDKYFLDWLPNLNDKDAALALQGAWGVELAELSQFRKTELEGIKAFVTRTVDKIRPPYGRRVIESPRRCVFFGTTNQQKYLIDETGNRRFKPVLVGRLDFETLKRERLQLFAEAKTLWEGMKEEENRGLDLTGKARVFEAKIHQEKMVEDDSNSMEESMRKFLEKVEKKEVNFDLEKFRILDLFEGAGPLGGWKKENRNLQFAAKMLKKLGAEMRKIHGNRVWNLGRNYEGAGFL